MNAMTRIAHLKRAGLALRRRGQKVAVSPVSKITSDLRAYIQAHREELLAELKAMELEQVKALLQQLREQGAHITCMGSQVCLRPTDWAQAKEVGRLAWALRQLLGEATEVSNHGK